MDKEINYLVDRFYYLSVLAHVEHENVALTTKSFAQHKALDEFYETVIEIKDRVIEYLIGEGMLGKVEPTFTFTIEDIITASETLSEAFCEYSNKIKDDALMNIAGEFEESVGKLKYLYLFK